MALEPNQPQDRVTTVDINKEMREAYLQYSMSVIVGRALPDVRDGLKPVHRRILYAMKELSNTFDKPYKKSARVVGDVIGKYHPHGESAVYEAIVRMAQSFSLRFPLVDGQGNFGSVDGDSAAAMRYTEVRMTRLAQEILEDIDKETVPFTPNYDDTLTIPQVLPSKFPNILVNGTSGIAVGMATNIPPHNIGECVDACIKIIEEPQCTVDDLIKVMPGPDFPTGGTIAGIQGIHSAYKKGRGILSIKAEAEIIEEKDREKIIVTEIPYQVNKAKLIENIASLVREKRIEGISDIRDESSREGMRIVVLVKRGENANVILNQLFKFTQMQVSYGVILIALDSRNQPKTFNVKSVLEAFIDHRKDVVTRRCIFELRKAEARAHILEGLKNALEKIDEIIACIKACRETAIAREKLQEKFQFSEKQANAILEMRLQRLTGLERQKILDELKEISSKIAELRKILSDVAEIYKIIVAELTEIKEKYNNPRRTRIETKADDLQIEDLIAEEDMVVTFTNTGYIKRIPADQYRIQKRGGKGSKGMETREFDFVKDIFVASTLTTLMVFTDKGKLYWLKVHQLPVGSRISKGRAIANVLNLKKDEKIQAILPVDEFRDDRFVFMITEQGLIKKTPLSAFSKPRLTGLIALTTSLDDRVIDAKISTGSDGIFIATQGGMSIRFAESEVRHTGRTSKGVKGITLGKGDRVVGMEVLQEKTEGHLLMVTENGYGKRTPVSDYRTQSRGGVGVITQKTTDKVGKVVSTRLVRENQNLMISTNKGKVIRMSCGEISVVGRNTQGVRLINLNSGEQVSSFALIAEDDEENTGV